MLDVNIRTAGYDIGEKIIHDIAFSIEKGELVALIGANGAGKSTTIKTMLGLLVNMNGEISFGEKKNPYAYVPEHPTYYDYLTLWEHIELLMAARENAVGSWEKKAEELLHMFRMDKHKHEYLSKFSKGMKQKSMLILAFLTEPDFYIIDEPFIGLDPVATKEFLSYLYKEKERGAGILLCTHVLDTAERICERFLLISQGTLVADGHLESIQTLAEMPGSSLLDCFDVIVRREQHD
ncbi:MULTISPECIES: ABC transporter ATP-binding protein [Bacillus]|uniref:ABC transporter ATP-binding protein n=2 Tax=Bacillus cereus group TaxID=86661 RepID=A0A2A7D6P2_BACAN|nr:MULTISPECIES: ABC transporter ATP-binding protein [Bacillus]MCP1163471.1 ABC transporter ATP-binding protein [Bacillus sp. 1813sda1]MDC7972734.1 ABC transporter ATP-binding protein [Bacillus sp. BLCC-B18]OTW72296.1 multidrug ABC transporter ATP-binding protein [Bacillus thuringiensis serovar coreanensis]OTX49353.1 multidrug ABC transporter ATP-binding protein [Bacillus thuringiensis serovar sooncheon]OTX57470.1 multidrug ABC transporter ATP-binding protein [Bacillus thuringiensis serovar gu